MRITGREEKRSSVYNGWVIAFSVRMKETNTRDMVNRRENSLVQW